MLCLLSSLSNMCVWSQWSSKPVYRCIQLWWTIISWLLRLGQVCKGCQWLAYKTALHPHCKLHVVLTWHCAHTWCYAGILANWNNVRPMAANVAWSFDALHVQTCMFILFISLTFLINLIAPINLCCIAAKTSSGLDLSSLCWILVHTMLATVCTAGLQPLINIDCCMRID